MKQDMTPNSILLPEFIETNLQHTKSNHYEKLYKLMYNFKNENIPYMNFPVEILLGRKTTGILVQYSIEHKKTVSKSMPKPI